MSKPNTPKKRLALFCLAIYGFFLVFLGIVEGVVRLNYPYLAPIKFLVKGPTHGDDADGARTFEGDPLLGWRLRPNLSNVWWDYTTFSTNAGNIRYPREIGVKTEDILRIVCLGDSVTFGYRVPVAFPGTPNEYDRSALPYFRFLEKKLAGKYPNRKVEVIPLAVPGYSSHQGLAWLRRDISWLRPDLLIACFGWNDTDYRDREDKETLPVGRLRVLARSIMCKSQALMHLSVWYQSLKTPSTGQARGRGSARVNTLDYIKNIMSINRLARKNGAQVLILGQVYRDANTNPSQAKIITENRRRLKKICGEKGIPYLEIEELTEKAFPWNKHLFGELIHPNKEGHRLMSQKIFDFLNDNDFPITIPKG